LKRDVGKPAPARFDALKLAERGGSLTGEVDASRLARLADRVAPPSEAQQARIEWRVVGDRDDRGRPVLTLGLDGTVFMTCQRCLRPLAVPVAQQTVLLLAGDEAELARLDVDEAEVILANGPLDCLTLVEDELLLSLPFAPSHAESACVAAAAVSPPQDAPSPFAHLAGLKTGARSRN
jgi:uncharacterized protein